MPEEQDIDTNVEQDDTTEGSNGVSLETAIVQKRKALEQRNEEREKNKKLQEEVDRLKGLVPQPPVNPQTNIVPDNVASKDDLRRIEFAVNHRELDAEDIKEIIDVAKGKGIDLEDAYKLPYFQSYFQDKIKSRQTSNAIPTGNRSATVRPSKSISEMTRDEHKEYWEKLKK